MSSLEIIRCSYCDMGHVKKEDIPCPCPNCGVMLTEIMTVPNKWLEDMCRQEDERFLKELEYIIRKSKS